MTQIGDPILEGVQSTQDQVFGGGLKVLGAFDGGDIKVLPIEFAMKGSLPTPAFVLGMNNTIDTGLTATDATGWPIGNNHLGINVNSITGSGVVVITGDSMSEASAVPSIGDTENITVDATGMYQSNKKWWRVDSVTIPVGISAINYDLDQIGYWDNGNTDFRIVGYRFEVTPTSASLIDFLLHIHKIQDDGSGKMTVAAMEDIQISGTTPFVDDNLRTAGNDRSYTGGQIQTVGIPTIIKQTDFESFFVADENIIEGASKAEGIVVEIAAWDNVDFITGFIYYKTGTGL